jgi:hypothetical protein
VILRFCICYLLGELRNLFLYKELRFARCYEIFVGDAKPNLLRRLFNARDGHEAPSAIVGGQNSVSFAY